MAEHVREAEQRSDGVDALVPGLVDHNHRDQRRRDLGVDGSWARDIVE